jgi:Protein of unknown function (DUF3500)
MSCSTPSIVLGVLLALVLIAVVAACSGRRAHDGGRERAARSDAPPDGAGTATGEAAPGADATATDMPAAPAADKAMAAAARGLLDAAGDARDKVARPFDDDREDWSYVPRSRAGLALGEMDGGQRSATNALLRAGLSPGGYHKVTGILRIEPILGQIEGSPSFRDPGRYHVAVFGQPGGQSPWGWRFEGHHLSLNFTHAHGRVSSTPAFFGANPARVPSGRHQGLRVLAQEEDLGRALLVSLDDQQRRRAVLSSSAPSDIVTESSRRVSLERFEGLPASQMTPEQRAALLKLVEIYVHNFQPELAQGHLDRMEAAGLDRIHFAWAGGDRPGQSHYYRIHGPTHVIELDNRGGNHIHSVLRDLQHDFGDGLLARHLREHHRDHAPSRARASTAMKSSASSKWASSTASSASKSAR